MPDPVRDARGGCKTRRRCAAFPSGTVTVTVATLQLKRGTCTFAATELVERRPVTFDRASLACGTIDRVACGRVECLSVPDLPPSFERICIHREGDHPCPTLDYASRFVSYKSFADARGCSPCGAGTTEGGTCANPTGGTPNGRVTLTDPVTFCCTR
jgi:hypothetical protein